MNKLKNTMNKRINTESVFCHFIQISGLAFLCTLIGRGLVSWLVMDYGEHLYYLSPSVKILVFCSLVLIIAFALFYLLAQKVQIRPMIAFWLFFLISVLWALSGEVEQEADSLHCLRIAKEIDDGITHAFLAGQYLDVYWRNSTLIAFMAALCKVVGQDQLLISFQLINAIVTSIAIYAMYKYLYYYVDKKKAMYIYAVSVLFFPMWGTVNFAYGNSIGHSLGIIGCVYFFKSLKEKTLKNCVLAMLYVSLSGLFKGYMYIFFVAFVLVYVFNAIRFKTKKWFAIIVTSFSIILLSVYFSSLLMSYVSDGKLRENGGVSPLSDIYTGLDIYEDQDNPGWYTGKAIETYIDAGYDKQKQNEIIKDDFNNLFDRIKQEPVSYLKAIYKKNHTIWNEPTFGVLYRNSIDFGKNRQSAWWTNLVSVSSQMNRWIVRFLRSYQFLVYIGVVISIISGSLGDRISNNLFLLSFFGAYLFLGMWEAKSEYALIFFFLLIPYASMAYYNLFLKVFSIRNSVDIKEKLMATLQTNRRLLLGAILCIMLIIVSAVNFNVTNSEEEFNEYLKDHAFINPGDYELVSVGGNIKLSNIYVDFNHTEWNYTIYDNSERKYEVFMNWDDINNFENNKYAYDENKRINIFDWRMLNDVDKFTWNIEQESYGNYVIRCWDDQNKVWTYNENTKEIELKDYTRGDNNQIWKFE